MWNLEMPQQEEAHLEVENAESNFHLFSKGSFLLPELHSNDSVDERKDTWSSRRRDRSIAGSLLQYKGSACWAVDWWKAQNNLQLVTENVTPSLTRHLARLEQHQHLQMPEWSNIGFFQLLSLLSFIHFTFWFGVDTLCSVGLLCLFKLLWNLFLCLLQRRQYTSITPFSKPAVIYSEKVQALLRVEDISYLAKSLPPSIIYPVKLKGSLFEFCT